MDMRSPLPPGPSIRESRHRLASLPANISAASPYSRRPPSPPYIHVPQVLEGGRGSTCLTITPDFSRSEPTTTGLHSLSDFERVTHGRTFRADDGAAGWQYEQKRRAQAVLPFLYLGPHQCVRDQEFLRREGITMLLCSRDRRMAAARMLGVERFAAPLGLAADYVDYGLSRTELVGAFSAAIDKINAHLLGVWRRQERDSIVGPADRRFREGKVLVVCESGNEASAAIVTAYLMAMSVDMNTAVQFVSLARFSSSSDDSIKWVLKTFEGLLNARRMVHGFRQGVAPRERAKRGIDEMMQDERGPASGAEILTGRLENGHPFTHDSERFVERDSAPFIDGDGML